MLASLDSFSDIEFAFHIWRMLQEILRSDAFKATEKSLVLGGGGVGGAAERGRMKHMNSTAEITWFLLRAHRHQRRVLSTKVPFTSSTCKALLFHLEIFLFFLYFFVCVLEMSRPLARGESSENLQLCSHMGSFTHSPEPLQGGWQEKLLFRSPRREHLSKYWKNCSEIFNKGSQTTRWSFCLQWPLTFPLVQSAGWHFSYTVKGHEISYRYLFRSGGIVITSGTT